MKKYKHRQTGLIAIHTDKLAINYQVGECEVPHSIIENTNDWEQIIEPKEEIKDVLGAVIVHNPTPETRSILNGKRYVRYVSFATREDLKNGKTILDGRYFHSEKTDTQRYKIIIITEGE